MIDQEFRVRKKKFKVTEQNYLRDRHHLNDLGPLFDMKSDNLKAIHISGTSVSKLDVDSVKASRFPNLQKIKAPNNQIEFAKLQISSLIVLVLTNNHLTGVKMHKIFLCLIIP